MKATLIRAAAYVVVLAAAIGGVYVYAKRAEPAPKAAAPAEHNHAAMAAGGGAEPRAVRLSAEDARRIGVTYAKAVVGELRHEVRTVGQVTLDETRVKTVAPKVDGWVDDLLVNATGQRVAAGDPLLTVYYPMVVAAEEELLLALRLQRDVAAADSSARRRADDLVAAARRRLSWWDVPDRDVADLERSGVVKKTLTLRSPASGFVIEKNVLGGQRIMAGDALYKVADLSEVWIEGDVFEQDLGAVHLGQLVEADFQSLPGATRTGRISFVQPTLNPTTRTGRLRVVLANPDLALKPGMFATIRITGTARAGVVTVPRSAVLSTGERTLVFVRADDGRLVPREVVLGAADDTRVEIVRGVKAGETVVASATFLVDAESNLNTALGGMGDMPGMDMTTPPVRPKP